MKVLLTGATHSKDEATGRFLRKRREWSLDNFDDGYIDNRGRFRVWMPNHPRAYKEGYVLRAIVAYELYHNTLIPNNWDVHHRDKNRLNDSKENLEILPHRAILSNLKKKLEGNVDRICENCGKTFKIKLYRLKDSSNGSLKRGRFCSQSCYHKYRRK